MKYQQSRQKHQSPGGKLSVNRASFGIYGDLRRTRTPTMGTGIPRSILLNYEASNGGQS